LLLCARRTGGSPLGRSVRLARGAGARGASTSTSSSAAPAITKFVRPIAATFHARARLLPLQVAPACRSSYSAGCGPANIVPSIFAFAAYIALAVLPSIKNFVRSFAPLSGTKSPLSPTQASGTPIRMSGAPGNAQLGQSRPSPALGRSAGSGRVCKHTRITACYQSRASVSPVSRGRPYTRLRACPTTTWVMQTHRVIHALTDRRDQCCEFDSFE